MSAGTVNQVSITTATRPVADVAPPAGSLVMACPACRTILEPDGSGALRCPSDGSLYVKTDGIWRMLATERTAYFETFIQEYEAVRHAEGRGTNDPAYYRALPFEDLTGRFADDWHIRATSFRALIERAVEPLEASRRRPLHVLDLGAGNGWLSYRLAKRGHHVAAVDLLTNRRDGLGAFVHYDAAFTPVQAEFDRLPFADSQADLVIFNGAFHYSTDYLTTLAEALRVLRDDGQMVIIDSPVYRDAASGQAMVREREAQFTKRFGFPSNAIPSENFLTHQRLHALADALGITWRIDEPFYGIRWALRPWKARLRGRREPARFLLIAGTRGAAAGVPTSAKRAGGAFGAGVWRQLLRLRFHLFQRHRYDRLVLEHVADRPILVLPQVFNPALFRTGEIVARILSHELIPPGSAVLDMGTGSGISAIAAAEFSSRVVAVDINPEAVRCARINVLLNRVEDRVDVRHGDLFDAVEGERFDIVLFNPPYFRGAPCDALDRAWRSTDVVERFAAGLSSHLTPDGASLVVLSSDGDAPAFLEAFRQQGLDISVLSQTDLVNEMVTIYQLKVRRG